MAFIGNLLWFVFGGGIIPEEDIPFLKSKGIRGIFTPGASIRDVTAFIEAETLKGSEA